MTVTVTTTAPARCRDHRPAASAAPGAGPAALREPAGRPARRGPASPSGSARPPLGQPVGRRRPPGSASASPSGRHRRVASASASPDAAGQPARHRAPGRCGFVVLNQDTGSVLQLVGLTSAAAARARRSKLTFDFGGQQITTPVPIGGAADPRADRPRRGHRARGRLTAGRRRTRRAGRAWHDHARPAFVVPGCFRRTRWLASGVTIPTVPAPAPAPSRPAAAREPRPAYECDACGHQPPKWVGRCPECGEWGSVVESHRDRPDGLRPGGQLPGAGRAGPADRHHQRRAGQGPADRRQPSWTGCSAAAWCPARWCCWPASPGSASRPCCSTWPSSGRPAPAARRWWSAARSRSARCGCAPSGWAPCTTSSTWPPRATSAPCSATSTRSSPACWCSTRCRPSPRPAPRACPAG